MGVVGTSGVMHMRRLARLSVVVLFAMLPLATHFALAANSVDLSLVLLTDVSRSIDDAEFDLEKQGYAAAFTDQRVIAAIQIGRAHV